MAADWPVWGRPLAEVLKRPGMDPAAKERDLADAKALMSAAGFPNGFETTYDVQGSPNTFTDWMILELAKIGIRATVKVTPTAEWDKFFTVEKKYTFTDDSYAMITSDPDEEVLELSQDGCRAKQ